MTKEPTLLCMSSSAFHLLRLHGPCTILAIEKILFAICAKKLRKQSFIFSIRFCVTLCIPCTCFSPHTGTWGYYDLRQEDWCGLMHQHVPGVGHPSGAQSVGSQEQQRWRMSKEAHLVIHLDNQSTLGSPTTKARPPRDSQVGPGPAKLSGLIFAPQSFPPSTESCEMQWAKSSVSLCLLPQNIWAWPIKPSASPSGTVLPPQFSSLLPSLLRGFSISVLLGFSIYPFSTQSHLWIATNGKIKKKIK